MNKTSTLTTTHFSCYIPNRNRQVDARFSFIESISFQDRNQKQTKIKMTAFQRYFCSPLRQKSLPYHIHHQERRYSLTPSTVAIRSPLYSSVFSRYNHDIKRFPNLIYTCKYSVNFSWNLKIWREFA